MTDSKPLPASNRTSTPEDQQARIAAIRTRLDKASRPWRAMSAGNSTLIARNFQKTLMREDAAELVGHAKGDIAFLLDALASAQAAAPLLKQIQDALVEAFYDPDPVEEGFGDPIDYSRVQWVDVIKDARKQIDKLKAQAAAPSVDDAFLRGWGMGYTALARSAEEIATERANDLAAFHRATEKEAARSLPEVPHV